MKKLPALLASAALALTGFALATTPAAAATNCVMGPASISSTKVVVGISRSKTHSVKVKVTRCSPTQAKNLRITWRHDGTFDGEPLGILKGSYEGSGVYTYRSTFTYRPSELVNRNAGIQDTFLAKTSGTIWEPPSQISQVPDFRLQRAARFNPFDVITYPDYTPKKGENLKMLAVLELADWRDSKTPKYSWHSTYKLVLQFRTPNGAYRNVDKSLLLGGKFGSGSYNYVKATGDGCYRVVWRGSSTTGAVTSADDCVNITG